MKPLPNTPFAPLGARRMLAALVIVFGCSCDGESPTDTNGGTPPTNIVFHFDSNPGSEFNPTITNGPVTLSFVTDATVNSAGVVQFVNDFRAIPYRGKGNLRLSKGAGGQPGFEVAVDLYFSIDVYSISLHVFQGDELAGMPVTTPFTFEGFDGNGTSLGTMVTTGFAVFG